jgi:hypothetical protein
MRSIRSARRLVASTDAHDRAEHDGEHRPRVADDECMQWFELEVESASGHGCLTAALALGKGGELLARLRLTGIRAQPCHELEDTGRQAVAAPHVAVLPPRVRHLLDIHVAWQCRELECK